MVNEKIIKERLGLKNLRQATLKYLSDHKNYRYNKLKKTNRIFIGKKLAIKVIKDCKATALHKFGARLGFKQYDITLNKEQTILTKMKSSFEGDDMQTQYSLLGYRIDLCFHDNKLAMEIDENGHNERNIAHKIKTTKSSRTRTWL